MRCKWEQCREMSRGYDRRHDINTAVLASVLTPVRVRTPNRRRHWRLPFRLSLMKGKR